MDLNISAANFCSYPRLWFVINAPTPPRPTPGDPGSPQEDAGEAVGLNFKAAQSSEKQHCVDQQQIKSDQVNPGEGGPG